MTQDAVKQVVDHRTVFRPGESVASMPSFDNPIRGSIKGFNQSQNVDDCGNARGRRQRCLR